MVLGDAVTKLETFVWILNDVSRSITWVSVQPKRIKLDEMTNLKDIFHVHDGFNLRVT